MCKVIASKANTQTGNFGSNLDTLAQLPTDGNKANLKKRARSKFYSNRIVGPLLYINSPLHKQYNRAYHCNHTLIQHGKKITGRYCNSRICNICNRIRTAKFMNGYGEPLKALGAMEFTTLTIPNCKADELKATISQMCINFSNILRVIRERRKIKISGIRKIEVTYNPKADTYHPHLHIMIDKAQGDELIKEWLQRYPKADRKGQDTRPVTKGSFNELFKYSTKVLVKGEKNSFNIYVNPLDCIMRALDKRRTFQTFGKIKKVSEDVEELQAVEVEDIESSEVVKTWEYNEFSADWFSISDGEALTGYEPPDIEFTVYL